MRIGRPPVPVTERLMDKVWMCPMSGCWIFVGDVNRHGYGLLVKDGSHRRVFAHRVSWERHVGPIPSGMFVCHHCDVPACVNPAHLFAGTPKDNTQDMHRKGRGHLPTPPRGAEHHAAKLTAHDVDTIRARWLTTSIRQLATEYGVGRSHMHGIVKHLKWRKHISPIEKRAFVATQKAAAMVGATDSERWAVLSDALRDVA